GDTCGAGAGSTQARWSAASRLPACTSVRLRGLARCFCGASISSMTLSLMILARRAADREAAAREPEWCVHDVAGAPMVAGAVAATPRKLAADGRGCLAISSRWLEGGIPIFVIAGAPVGTGLVANWARQGGELQKVGGGRAGISPRAGVRADPPLWGPNWELVERLSRSPDHFNRWQ